MLIYLKFHRIEFTWFHYSITCTYFLLHLSSPLGGRALPAMLLSGVRTFLPNKVGTIRRSAPQIYNFYRRMLEDKSLSNETRALVYFNMGLLANEQDEYMEALDHFLKAEELGLSLAGYGRFLPLCGSYSLLRCACG